MFRQGRRTRLKKHEVGGARVGFVSDVLLRPAPPQGIALYPASKSLQLKTFNKSDKQDKKRKTG